MTIIYASSEKELRAILDASDRASDYHIAMNLCKKSEEMRAKYEHNTPSQV